MKQYFKWLDNSKYNISYHQIESSLEENIYSPASNIVINTKEADIRLISINKHNVTSDQNGIDFIYLIPFFGQTKSQIIDIFSLGMFHSYNSALT